MRLQLPVVYFALVGAGAAQIPNGSPVFEAATVKPAVMPSPGPGGRVMIQGPSGGPGTKDPGRVRYPFSSLHNLLMVAYDVKAYQVTGPSWIDSERYEVTAVMPPETTKEQFQQMLRNLLADRFRLKVHQETKEMPMYSLTVAKGGPKLKEAAPAVPVSSDGPPAPPPMMQDPKIGADGFPVARPGPPGSTSFMMMPGRARVSGNGSGMDNIVNMLSNQLKRPVMDATGLTAKYDFVLTFSTEGMEMGGLPMGGMRPGVAVGAVMNGPAPAPEHGPAGDAEPVPDLLSAVKSQLGLQLEAKKGPVPIVVVDGGEKTPLDN